MPFFSSFTGSFSGGRRKPISIGVGGGGGGAPGEIDFSSMSVTYQFDDPNDPLYKGQDRFGNTVAIDGTTAVIGAYEAEDAGGNASGFVAVYDLTDGSRTYSVANPNPFGTSAFDQFGYSVDISGDNFIVGAYKEDTDLVSGLASGKAYIFRTSDGALLHTLDNPNLSGTDTDNFGQSVAIYGNYAVVGAPNEQEVGGTLYNAGAIHVYNVTTGALLFSRANPNTGADNPQDAFGRGLDINDQYIVVGATNEDTPASNSGVIHVYDLTGTLLRTIQNPNDYGTAENDLFGGFNRVSISGDKLLAGVNGEDGAAGDAVGVAYVFDLTDGSLLQTLRNPTPVAFDVFAQYVDLDGNYALIGAPGVDNPGGDTNGGAAFIFDITDGSLQSTIINPNVFASTSDGFGTGVAIAGEYVIVGSLEDEAGASNAGKAYVYKGVASGGGGGGGAVSWSGSFPVTATANTFVYDNAILAQDGAAETLVTDAFMHPDNNIILLCGNTRDLVYQIDLSSASDISTASYTGTNFDTTSQTATPNFINFSGDGTKMYIYSQKLNPQPGLFEYDLSTAWDITTATFNQSNTSLNDADYSYSLQFNDDGTKIYTASGITETIVYEFSLSSAYDISTINSTATATFNYSTITEITDPTSLRSMRISSDGTKIYFNINSQGIHECTLGTAWDLSTISYSATADISATDSSAYVLFFNSDGSEMYTSNVGTDTISQYTMS